MGPCRGGGQVQGRYRNLAAGPYLAAGTVASYALPRWQVEPAARKT